MTASSSGGGGRADDSPPVGRLITLLVLVGVWAVITVGIAFRAAEMTETYQYLTLFVALLASRYWGFPGRLLTESE